MLKLSINKNKKKIKLNGVVFRDATQMIWPDIPISESDLIVGFGYPALDNICYML